jgi:hypothetical protein
LRWVLEKGVRQCNIAFLVKSWDPRPARVSILTMSGCSRYLNKLRFSWRDSVLRPRPMGISGSISRNSSVSGKR